MEEQSNLRGDLSKICVWLEISSFDYLVFNYLLIFVLLKQYSTTTVLKYYYIKDQWLKFWFTNLETKSSYGPCNFFWESNEKKYKL